MYPYLPRLVLERRDLAWNVTRQPFADTPTRVSRRLPETITFERAPPGTKTTVVVSGLGTCNDASKAAHGVQSLQRAPQHKKQQHEL